MSVPVVKTDLEGRIGTAEIARFSRSSDPNITSAIAEAWDRFRSAALNIFTAASVDALTSGTLPSEAKGHIVDLAIEILSYGQGRAADIEARAQQATDWLGFLVGDKVRCFDGVLTKNGSNAGIDIVRINAPTENVFDRDNTSQRYNVRDWPI